MLTSVPDLIVSRHPGALQWLATQLPLSDSDIGYRACWEVAETRNALVKVRPLLPDEADAAAVRDGNVNEDGSAQVWPTMETYEMARIPVLAEAAPDDVRGRHVVGNLPLHLAALCVSITAIEFAGAPPRGAEYGVAEMEAAGARLAEYSVCTGEQYRAEIRRTAPCRDIPSLLKAAGSIPGGHPGGGNGLFRMWLERAIESGWSFVTPKN